MRRLIGVLFAMLVWPGLLWAAFPQVAGSNTSSHSTAVSSHTVNLPASIAAGELLLCVFASRDPTDISWPVGWTEFFQATVATSQIISGAWREADGGEGASITVTTPTTERSAHQCLRITGAADPDTQAPQVPTAATGTGVNPNPPALSPTGGAKDYLWLAVAGHEVVLSPVCVPTVSAYPANYTNGTQVTSGGGNETEGRIATARRELNASSEDPGTFTMTSTDCSAMEWVTTTIAVHPTGVAPPINFFPKRRVP